MSLPQNSDVIIIGAGLAGLSAAHYLKDSGLDVHVIESSDAVGGRVRSDLVDGLVLDRGFQLYNPAYEEGKALLDLKKLNIKSFTAGAIVSLDGKQIRLADPRRLPSWTFSTLKAPIGSLRHKLAFARYVLSIANRSKQGDLVDQRSYAFLERSFGKQLTQSVLQPFLAGVFLEENLDTSKRFLDVVMANFVHGSPGVPAHGMQQIPLQLASSLLPTNLHLETTVTEIRQTAADVEVTTSHGKTTTKRVIVAVSTTAARKLLPGLKVPASHSVTTWYHLADCPGSHLTDGLSTLVIDGNKFGSTHSSSNRPLVNSVVMTNAAPSYATDNRVLISSSAVGIHDSSSAENSVRVHLSTLYGRSTDNWELVATYPVRDALPAMMPPHSPQKQVSVSESIFIAGDFCDVSSINGAFASGRKSAENLLASLR